MQYKKLTLDQKAILAWRRKRNHLVEVLLCENRDLLRAEALKQANRLCGPMPGKPVDYRGKK